jgi:hypothetical protein
LFPLAPFVEVVNPISANPSVPELQATTLVASLPQATFTLKAVSVGTAVIHGGFLVNTLQFPDQYLRFPPLPEFDGKTTIQVIP